MYVLYSRQLHISCFSRAKQTPHALLLLLLLLYKPCVCVYTAPRDLITPLSALVSLPRPTAQYNTGFFLQLQNIIEHGLLRRRVSKNLTMFKYVIHNII